MVGFVSRPRIHGVRMARTTGGRLVGSLPPPGPEGTQRAPGVGVFSNIFKRSPTAAHARFGRLAFARALLPVDRSQVIGPGPSPVGTNASVNPRIYPGLIYGDITGTLRPEDQQLIDERGPDELVGQITAPTLLIQGTVDTLFTLAEADANAKALIAAGVPTKVVWYCGGHGACISTRNDGVMVKQATMDWLDRYVKGDLTVDTGPQFEWVDQHGTQFSSNTYPVPQGKPIVASSTKGGVLPLFPPIGGSGPDLRILTAGPIGALLGIPSGSRAINALNLTIPQATTTTYIVGAPQLTLTYSGTGTSRHVYAQFVDDSTGLVLGNPVTPVPVTLDGETHTISVPMEMVAQTLEPGESVTLQLVAPAFPYETITSLGVLKVSSMTLSLPTANAAAISVSSSAEAATAA